MKRPTPTEKNEIKAFFEEIKQVLDMKDAVDATIDTYARAYGKKGVFIVSNIILEHVQGFMIIS